MASEHDPGSLRRGGASAQWYRRATRYRCAHGAATAPGPGAAGTARAGHPAWRAGTCTGPRRGRSGPRARRSNPAGATRISPTPEAVPPTVSPRGDIARRRPGRPPARPLALPRRRRSGRTGGPARRRRGLPGPPGCRPRPRSRAVCVGGRPDRRSGPRTRVAWAVSPDESHRSAAVSGAIPAMAASRMPGQRAARAGSVHHGSPARLGSCLERRRPGRVGAPPCRRLAPGGPRPRRGCPAAGGPAEAPDVRASRAPGGVARVQAQRCHVEPGHRKVVGCGHRLQRRRAPAQGRPHGPPRARARTRRRAWPGQRRSRPGRVAAPHSSRPAAAAIRPSLIAWAGASWATRPTDGDREDDCRAQGGGNARQHAARPPRSAGAEGRP